jgi:hypothetical protein
MDTYGTSSTVSSDIVTIIREIRSTEEYNPDLLDQLIQIISNKKIILKYSTPTDTKFIFLTKPIVWKLRSFFINKSNKDMNTQTTAEYLNDIFIDDIYELEIHQIH